MLMSNIKLNLTFKSNVEYETKSHIQILNVKYQTKSNIQTLNVEYRISNLISHSNRMSNIELNPTFKTNVEYRI